MSTTTKAFTGAKQKLFLEQIRDGVQRGAAADVLGLDRRKTREFITTHPDFQKAVLDAEVDATEHVQEALYQAAVSGNVAAAKAWLEMHGSEKERSSAKGKSSVLEVPASGLDGDFADLDNVTPMSARHRRQR